MDRLSSYPFVVVRLRCHYCRREGQYRLARLAAKYGPELPTERLVDYLAADCPWRRGPGERAPRKYEAKCGAYLPDLTGPPRPPDLPSAMIGLRLIRGGRRE